MAKRRGNKLGFFIFDFYLSLGIKHAYALLYFVCIYYLIFDKKTVSITARYVKKRFNNAGVFTRLWHTYQLLISTGKNLIDLRQLELRPDQFKFQSDNEEIVKNIAKKKGLIMLTAHIGNWQIMMRKLPQFDVGMNIVMRPEENPAVSEFLKLDHAEPYNINLINPVKGIDAVIEIMQELEKGNIISIMGDRSINEEKTISVQFLSETISLPKGPFLIAATANVPTILLLTKKKGPCDYALEITDLTVDTNLKNKDEKTKVIAEKYIAGIEEYLTRNPYAWNATSMS